ncbi:hypothetical protein [Candidatus Nitrosotalea sp. TS]|uniref:hypothetical protein n=1 Tax=Candidatus Nitrosotalea sp. TS TaxID=2341020 RepID=UPI00140912A0|nr:hypothetical protein [Candidatus Nitrosotalea sp. TS]
MLGFAMILVVSLGISANEAFAMGQAPSTCNNRYDGTITAMKITVGYRTYNPMANPEVSFQLKNDRSYTVTFTIHTPSQSSQNNTLAGDTWYDTSAPGYQLGTCVSGAAPNQDITLTETESHPGNLAPQTTQNVTWNTLVPGHAAYCIKWIN